MDLKDRHVMPTAEPKGQRDVSSTRPWLQTVLTTAFLALLLLGILASQPRFRQILIEFDVDLTAISTLALSPALPGSLGLLLILTIVKEFVIGDRKFLFASNLAAIALGVLAIVVYIVGLVWPLLSLLEDLS
jgi:hypothetical protein